MQITHLIGGLRDCSVKARFSNDIACGIEREVVAFPILIAYFLETLLAVVEEVDDSTMVSTANQLPHPFDRTPENDRPTLGSN